ncbi:MAG TPA: GNAT family N-acetyltransferase [Candidatus Ignatzschineria merdigallinarum]|uniref:GNAT family N-acetyltransferase n=1 Tax=Candidatus Ignatzschineria merdigallinarum TaxID=2838621 RepID=A0A9D1Q415_9GAMM|nr:GNAT family N-acetyltransferase [Candidatus Ignatzschineria merdigallinarum]
MRNIPKLETARLLLRPLVLDDALRIFHNFSQDCVTEFYDLSTFTKMEEAIDLINNWNQRTANGEGLRWAITYKETPELLIGTCGFHNFSKENNRAEIGYELSPEEWGKGVMTEAIREMIAYGFETLELHRIEAFIDPLNHASRKLLQKDGMKTEGVLRDYFFEKGRFVDAEMLSILRTEYQES